MPENYGYWNVSLHNLPFLLVSCKFLLRNSKPSLFRLFESIIAVFLPLQNRYVRK